jgi:hypothetical protein
MVTGRPRPVPAFGDKSRPPAHRHLPTDPTPRLPNASRRASPTPRVAPPQRRDAPPQRLASRLPSASLCTSPRVLPHHLSPWALGVGCWALGVGRWALGVGRWGLGPRASFPLKNPCTNSYMDLDSRRCAPGNAPNASANSANGRTRARPSRSPPPSLPTAPTPSLPKRPLRHYPEAPSANLPAARPRPGTVARLGAGAPHGGFSVMIALQGAIPLLTREPL